MKMMHKAMSDMKFDRLIKAVEWSLRKMSYPREERIRSIRQFVGNHYAEDGSQKNVPVNFLKLAVDIYVRQLAARAPRALITTKFAELKPVASNFELAINQVPVEINLTRTLRRLVTEALFSVGITKTGLHDTGIALGEVYGETFVDNITLDDFFCDMSAKRLDLIQFCGNDYWLPHEDVMEANWKYKDVLNQVKPDKYTSMNDSGEEGASSIMGGEDADVFKERVHLRDVWMPAERIMLTYAVTSKKLLHDIEWEGPDSGPYQILGFTEVPGNLLPLAPVSTWRDLHELSNALFRKLGTQADNQKSVLGFNGTEDEDIENFKKARDGDGILYSGPPPTPLIAGGVSQTTLAFYLQCKDLYSYFAGNLDSLGGLAPATDTVGQDRLLSEAAGAQLREMAARTVEITKDIFKSIAWYEWYDPLKTRVLQKPIPGTAMSIPIDWNEQSKVGGFDMYDFDIDIFSLQDDSPGIKLQKLNSIVNQYIIPLLPAIQQSGGNLDVQALLKMIARYSDFDEVGELVTWTDQEPNTASNVPQGAGPVNMKQEMSDQSAQQAGPPVGEEALRELLGSIPDSQGAL